jgi:5-(carboxyamino)imidazole ribonucleotide synthase
MPIMVSHSTSNTSERSPQTIKRIGVIGGGQLAWMMASAAQTLGLKLVVQASSPSDPAVALASDAIFAPIDDAAGTANLASRCDVITFENEFIDLEALRPLAQQGVCFRPRLEALAPLLDKYEQRCYLEDIGIPQPDFLIPEEDKEPEESNIQRAFGESINLHELNFPIVLKARRCGYDGQGTAIVEESQNLQATGEQLGRAGGVLLEEFIPFERELAAIAARSVTGEVVVYPIVETQQVEQVCRRAFIPAQLPPPIVADIEAIAKTLLNSLQVVGVFGIELFLTPSGKVLVNEVSPRTHNSGHFSLDACETSQFEMHLRAVAGLPLGSPQMRCAGAVMVNLLGYEHSQSDYLQKREQLAALPQTFVHWYGKTESRPGRKLGHVTALLDSSRRDRASAIAREIESLWYG